MSLLIKGMAAPDFCLSRTHDQQVSLSEFRGKNVVLAFYPADWSPVCGDQLAIYNEIIQILRKQNTELLGISVDGIWCHLAYAEHRRYKFPLLSDFEPKGATAKKYGVYRENSGYSERALYVIDPEGKIFWSYLSPIGVNPGADGILDALESLNRKAAS